MRYFLFCLNDLPFPLEWSRSAFNHADWKILSEVPRSRIAIFERKQTLIWRIRIAQVALLKLSPAKQTATIIQERKHLLSEGVKDEHIGQAEHNACILNVIAKLNKAVPKGWAKHEESGNKNKTFFL